MLRNFSALPAPPCSSHTTPCCAGSPTATQLTPKKPAGLLHTSLSLPHPANTTRGPVFSSLKTALKSTGLPCWNPRPSPHSLCPEPLWKPNRSPCFHSGRLPMPPSSTWQSQQCRSDQVTPSPPHPHPYPHHTLEHSPVASPVSEMKTSLLEGPQRPTCPLP